MGIDFQLFFKLLVEKYSERYGKQLQIEISDSSGLIIAASGSSGLGSKSLVSLYAIDKDEPMIVRDANTKNESVIKYYSPILLEDDVWGVVIVSGKPDLIRICGESIRDAIESFLNYENDMRRTAGSADSQLVSNLISGTPDKDYILKNIGTTHYSDDNIYAVILIKMDLSKMNYFNIKLDLGYDLSLQTMQSNLLATIKNNEYITDRDMLAFVENDCAVIIKSFLKIDSIFKVYISLDIICKSILQDLLENSTVKFHLCYGNTYQSIFDVHHSYRDACEIMEMNSVKNPNENLYTLDGIFFENVCETLHPQVVNKTLLLYLNKLMSDNEIQIDDMLHLAEEYVNNCMHISLTAQRLFMHRNTVNAKLERFKKITGLDPAKNFQDALLVKMLAIYYKKSNQKKN